METMRLNCSADELDIKEEEDWRLEELHAPAMAFQECSVEAEPSRTLRENSHIRAETHGSPHDTRKYRTRLQGPGQERRRRTNWTEKSEIVLIALWNAKTGGVKSVKRDNQLCQELAVELGKNGFQRTATEVKVKLHNLHSKYYELKRNASSPTWIHYDRMHAILGEDKAPNSRTTEQSTGGESQDNDPLQDELRSPKTCNSFHDSEHELPCASSNPEPEPKKRKKMKVPDQQQELIDAIKKANNIASDELEALQVRNELAEAEIFLAKRQLQLVEQQTEILKGMAAENKDFHCKFLDLCRKMNKK